VPGLLTRGKRFFDELKKGLEASGYNVTYEVVQLADYGVPQFRKRLVLFAALEGSIQIPRPLYRDPKLKRGRPWRTVRDAISFLPRPPLRSRVKAGKAKPRYKWHYARDVAPAVRRRLKHALRTGKSRRSLPKSLRLACHERRPDGYHDVYGVMSWKHPSPTITSGCTNASKGRFGHPGAPRPLTATEAALLQTFPAGYRFEASGLESLAAQIGNALPKRFAKVAGKAVVKHLS
jgi:DNA (cytosine-5)-methyltransferase 1